MANATRITKTKASQAKRNATSRGGESTTQVNYPRHHITDALRIPKAVLNQNAGKKCTDTQAAQFIGLKAAKGPTGVEISSAIKYGFLNRPESKKIEVTGLGRKVLRPKSPEDERDGQQQAIMNAPVVSDDYKHYRGENLPDRQFFENALEDTFNIPKDKLSDFQVILISSLERAALIEKHGGRVRVLDAALSNTGSDDKSEAYLDKLSTGVTVASGDSCFVLMPFAPPIGEYYSTVYKPAIEKAKLTPVRADNDIFGSGKIMDQIWSGINAAKVLVAELTTKNPNVFYELGLAHALQKPVVLVSSNEDDVPFDLKQIRVIYYDKDDPFWGQ